MSHTKGPWHVKGRPGKGYGKAFDIYTPKGRAFEGNQLEPDGVSIGAAQANAKLAAAAPDMLEALQRLVERIEYYSSLRGMERPNIEDWEYTEGSGDMAKARAAIKKATQS